MYDGLFTFTKQEWQQVVADKLSGDEEITTEEIKEILDYLWDYLPPLLHSKVIKTLENNKIETEKLHNLRYWE